MAKQIHKSKDDRFQEAITAMLVIENRGESVTSGKVARYMKMANSTYLRNIIKKVVDSGYADERQTLHWNGWKRSVYVPSHHRLNDNCQEWYHKTMAEHGLYISMGTLEGWIND